MNPYSELVKEVKAFVEELGRRLNIDLSNVPITRAQPRFGYISVPLHNVAREFKDLDKIVKEIAENFNFRYLNPPEYVNGFLNFDIEPRNYSKLVIDAVLSLGESYGRPEKPMEGLYLIEHTSANPLHPLHLGHGRNAILGDTLARLLKFCGANVRTHFYLDDCGDQVSYAALGFSLVRDLVYERIRSGRKPDHVIGIVYAVTCTVAEIQKLSRELEKLKDTSPDKYREVIAERDDLVAALAELEQKDKELVLKLIDELRKIPDIESEVKKITRLYEEGDENVKRLVREMINLVIKGFEETLTRLGISFDSWDWESEITIYSGKVYEVLRRLIERAFPYIERVGNVIVFRADKYAADMDLWDKLKLPRHLPKVTLTRSDGTTLYITRDLAYAVWCFEKFNPTLLIRVIAAEQQHPQAQIRTMLYAMGYVDWAQRLVHYAYELVNIPGVKMSGRRGRYVALDDLVDEAKRRVMSMISDRFSDPKELEKVSEAVAVGAIRYSLLSVSPNKPILFKWDKVLNLKQNSGPFIQYTYVRAKSILEKAGVLQVLSYSVPETLGPEEVELVKYIGEVPEIIQNAARDLRPDYVVEHVNKIALAFNSFYEKYPVIHAEEPYRGFRLALVLSVKRVLENVMNILGIPVLERM